MQTLQSGLGLINAGDAAARLIDVQYQPVMPIVHLNWSAFSDACDVPYCDVTQLSPFGYRAFTAFSQIGGFTTVAVVALRFVLRPLCTWLLLPKSMLKTASSTAASSLPLLVFLQVLIQILLFHRQAHRYYLIQVSIASIVEREKY